MADGVKKLPGSKATRKILKAVEIVGLDWLMHLFNVAWWSGTIPVEWQNGVVVKRELSWKIKPSIYWSIFVPTLTYGHEIWVVTKRTRLQIQAAEIGFLMSVTGLSLTDRRRSSVIRKELGVELLLRIERRFPPFGNFPGTSNWEGPPGQTQNSLYIGLGTCRFPQEELGSVAEDVWVSLLNLWPL